VSVLCNQGSGLRAALRAAIERGASGIISFGIAGGLAPHLAAGDWVVASGVASGEDVIATDRAWTQRLLDQGYAFVTPTTHNGEPCTRFATINPRTTVSDLTGILATMS